MSNEMHGNSIGPIRSRGTKLSILIGSLAEGPDENWETLVQCRLDTGATCNVISFDKLCEIKQSGKPGMQPTTSKLRLYDGSMVQALGECDLQCKYKGNQHLLNFKIISGSQQPLLSGETCTGMGLITVHVVNSINMSQASMPLDVLTKYKDVFEGLGCLPGEYHLEHCSRPEHEEVCRLNLESVNAAEFVRISSDGLKNIQRLTEADNQLQRLRMTVLRGWPETKQEIEPLIAEYWTYRDEIGVYNGVLYKGDRVIVPTALRKDMMKRIHASHQGQQACLRRAKDVLFWPGMSSQIKEAVSNCSLCAEYQRAQPKEPLITPELPSRPWSIVAQDLYSFQGNNFLITVDAFSGYWEVDKLPQTTSPAVIDATKQHFARYGIPDRPIRLMPSPMDTSRKWRRGVCIKKVAPRSYLVDVKGSIYRRNRKFLRIAKDRLPGTVQENRQQLNPETAQANPGTQTPCQQLKPPLPDSRSPPDNTPDELDVLLEEIIERGKVAKENSNFASEKKEKDKATGEEIRREALERMGQTKKRNSQDEGEWAVKETRKRRSGNDAVEFLKAKCDKEIVTT
ncbi:Uncharacterized protein P5673_029852 [Acropora cervicornis]|uniref:Integrase zinc-binding domain-containing protein n=1 Tax=Acropora cervicornis TaxID=6130 RepID=A0AAD9UTR3_ACRCE|nr:Uncharacterized protein P5673_029852 [Acropora cervicornis]